jgi:hypothetical protein
MTVVAGSMALTYNLGLYTQVNSHSGTHTEPKPQKRWSFITYTVSDIRTKVKGSTRQEHSIEGRPGLGKALPLLSSPSLQQSWEWWQDRDLSSSSSTALRLLNEPTLWFPHHSYHQDSLSTSQILGVCESSFLHWIWERKECENGLRLGMPGAVWSPGSSKRIVCMSS